MEKLLKTLQEINYEELDIDEILDHRDSEPFDNNWVRVYQTIETIKEKTGCISNSDGVREKAFKMVYELSGCGELAGYISDDFGLIADGKMLKYSDEWLDKLVSCYEKLIIPCGKL